MTLRSISFVSIDKVDGLSGSPTLLMHKFKNGANSS